MGAGISTAEGFPTEISSKTHDAQVIANEIFRYMLTKMKFNEYLTLANPETCKNYVILMADALEKYFYKIRLYPGRDISKAGKPTYIYFRKITDIKDAGGDMRRYCTGIAYFFVRIFQIYGALALSILDSDTKFYEALPYGGGGLFDSDDEEEENTMEGGAGKELDLYTGDRLYGDYDELRPYLKRVDGVSDYYKFEAQDIYISKRYFTFDGKIVHEIVYEAFIPGLRKRGSQTAEITAKLYVHKSSNDNLILQLLDIKGTQVKVGDTASYVFKKPGGALRSGEWKTQSGQTVKTKLEAIFTEILRSGRGPNVGTDDKDKDRDDYDRRYWDYENKKREEGWDEKKVPEPYKTRDLWETMKAFQGISKGQPVKAHCIARAIQLVSSRALEKAVPTQIISSVCMGNFMGSRLSGSLPKAEEEITKEKGIMALNQIFYDMIMPDLSPAMSPLAKQRFTKLLEFMSAVFKSGGGTTARLSDIKNKTASGLCSKIRDKHLMTSDKQTIATMREIVKGMLKRQVEHTAKVVLLMKKLFLVERGKPIQIHPLVLEGGIPVLNKIGDEARDLLIQYYVNCEKSYGDGVAVLERSKSTLRPF